MSRIASTLSRSKKEDQGALICYLTAGFPSFERGMEMMLACIEGGADILEIGVPFSDPVADGKAIQLSSSKAIEAGMTPRKVFEIASRIREEVDTPMVLMGYYNPIFRMSESGYLQKAAEAGVDGLIVPDLPMEESFSLMDASRLKDLDLIQLVGPTTNDERMRRIASASSGFLYLVSALGTTGERDRLPGDVGKLIERARRTSQIPIAVGFGISTPQQVAEVIGKGADAAIVGSAIIKRIANGESAIQVKRFVQELKKGCKNKG